MSYVASPSAIALLSLMYLAASPVVSQTLEKQREALNTIREVAEILCNAVPTSGDKPSPDVTAEVKSQTQALLGKLANAGISRAKQLAAENYQAVLQKQLEASVSNNVQCKLEVFRSLRAAFLSKEAPSRTFVVTRESGWRGGGYDPASWCADLISVLRGEHPQGQFQVIAKSEQSESRCSPFNCPQYNYSCTVQVTTSGEN